jgi:hypothetical protein
MKSDHSEEKGMIYETKICIEIEGIRRAIPLLFEYHIESVNGKSKLVHDSVVVLADEGKMLADWVYLLLGRRQRRELESHLLQQWTSKNAA